MNPNKLVQAILLACLSSWSIIGPQVAFAFAAPTAPGSVAGSGSGDVACDAPSSSSSNGNGILIITDPQLSALRRRIQSGRVYAHPNFLSERQLKFLQRDMNRLKGEGKFVVNGLSDVRKGMKGEPTAAAAAAAAANSNNAKEANQGFDVKYDRSVCPIPWWKDALSLSLEGGEDNDKNCNNSNEEELLLHSIQMRLQGLRKDLSDILKRPNMMDNELGHECYYSQSAPGSSLARHMDERHEETKGPRGWLLPSRRSLSWLIYLSEADDDDADADADAGGGAAWDAQINGGLLRTFPQKWYRNDNDNTKGGPGVECGSHNGNLQVGWLTADDNDQTRPVFLDSWHEYMNPYTQTPEPHCILYIVGEQQKIEYITVPWSIDAIGGGNVAEFIQQSASLEAAPAASSNNEKDAASLFLQKEYAQQFQLLEDRSAWTRGEMPAGSVVEDFAPTRGTLVVFDSVTLPHEVTAVVKGRRAALAGWFHENTQPLGGNGFQY